MNRRQAIRHIENNGMLLVFPVNNRKEPSSLWSQFFPRSKMRWEWDSDGDNRVAGMWALMKDLSARHETVYSKWYQGRATFISRELFTAMLADFRKYREGRLSQSGQLVLDTLEMDSPLSTKQLKAATDLQGKYNESIYNRAMKELFSRLLIVGFGEVDDGAFPSLAVGATKLIHEDLWMAAETMPEAKAMKCLDKYLPQGSAFRKYFDRTKAS